MYVINTVNLHLLLLLEVETLVLVAYPWVHNDKIHFHLCTILQSTKFHYPIHNGTPNALIGLGLCDLVSEPLSTEDTI